MENKNIINYILEGDNYPPCGSMVFNSSDHIRFQNGKNVSGHNYNCLRRLVIEKNIEGGEGYTVSMFNMDGIHPFWKVICSRHRFFAKKVEKRVGNMIFLFQTRLISRQKKLKH